MIGKTISHYKILEEIGIGGMGVVYKAQDIKLKRPVALKFLPPQLTQDLGSKKRFMLEAQAASALQHHNICTIYEISETDDGQLFIAMEYLTGKTLRERIEGKKPKTEEVLDIVTQLARGLDKAHQKGIIHRDIKPANILITEDNVVKIVDFGLAKLAGQTRLTKTGSTVGTVAYMSPEQTTGGDVDRRTDIWSLGVVFYEMLAGQLPFKGHYEQAIVYSILNEEPESLRKLNADVPEPLEQIVRKMLAKDPSQRYADLSGFLDEIKRFQAGKESRSIASAALRKFFSTPRFLIPVIVLLLFCVVAVFSVLKYGTKSGKESAGLTDLPSLAVVNFDNKSGDRNLDNWRDAFPELLTTDLSQSKYLRVLRSDQIYGIYAKLDLLKAERYTEQDLMDIARNGGVDHIVKGSYFKAGDHLVITAMLIHAGSGETISSVSFDAEGENEIFNRIDELTREIKLRLSITPDQMAGDIDQEISTISTKSAEALTHYLKGRQHHYDGDFTESIRSMEKALSFDPNFAMAYRSMTWSYYHMGLVSEQMQSLKKAMELSDNLPMQERYVIAGDYYRFNRQPGETRDKSLESIQKALQFYPDSPLLNGKLIELCADEEDWDLAIERFEFMKKEKIATHFDYHYVGTYYCAIGRMDQAVEDLRYYLRAIEEDWVIRFSLALVYPILHKMEPALSEINQGLSLAPPLDFIFCIKAAIHLFRGEFAEAEKKCQDLMGRESASDRLSGRKMYGLLYLLQGRLSDAEFHFREGKITAGQHGILWEEARFSSLLGYVRLLQGKYEQSLDDFDDELEIYQISSMPEGTIKAKYFKALVRLEQQPQERTLQEEEDLSEWAQYTFNKKFERYYLNYLGRKELINDHVSGAIVHFDSALSLLPHERPPWEGINDVPQVLFIEPLARAYLESGDLEKAQEAYEKIGNLTWGRLFYGNLYARSFYHLGGIYSRNGQKGKAVESYKKFIQLWKDCDPVFQPLVKDARERVKMMENGR